MRSDLNPVRLLHDWRWATLRSVAGILCGIVVWQLTIDAPRDLQVVVLGVDHEPWDGHFYPRYLLLLAIGGLVLGVRPLGELWRIPLELTIGQCLGDYLDSSRWGPPILPPGVVPMFYSVLAAGPLSVIGYLIYLFIRTARGKKK